MECRYVLQSPVFDLRMRRLGGFGAVFDCGTVCATKRNKRMQNMTSLLGCVFVCPSGIIALSEAARAQRYMTAQMCARKDACPHILKGVTMHYEFEAIDMKNIAVAQARVEGNAHRNAIDERAARGQRFVGFVPTVSGPSGKILAFDLVFEVDD